MNNKIIYSLLPLCISLLSGCKAKEVTYSFTLINKNKNYGTILTESGEHKEGDIINIAVELNQGYKVLKWDDSEEGIISKKTSFDYMMPARDVTISLFITEDEFMLSVKDKMVASEGYYDFADVIDLEFLHTTCYINDDQSNRQYYTGKHKYKSTINAELASYDFNGSIDFLNFVDDDGNVLGGQNTSFTMPNHNYTIYSQFTSSCRAFQLSSNINSATGFCTVTNFSGSHFLTINNVNERYFITPVFTTRTVYFDEYNSSDYVFDYWLNVDTGEVVSNEKSFTVEMDKPIQCYKAIVHEK